MREIADKHFPDNWVIPIYAGHLIDLTEYWNDNFPAAKKALGNNIILDQIKVFAKKHYITLRNSLAKLDKYIIEGKLIEEFVLDNIKQLMDCLREANVTIRWIMLHKNCKNLQFKRIVEDGANKDKREKEIVTLLMHLSKFENQLNNILTNLVSSKHQIWGEDKQKCYESMNEIAEYFSGNRNWGKDMLDENYANWFKNVASMI